MSPDIDEIIQRIRRLLAMASDISSPNEAAIAARRAHKLMEQYQLSRFDVFVEQMRAGECMTEREANPGRSFRQIPKWLNWILMGIAIITQTRIITRPDETKTHIGFQGEVGDVAVACILLPYVITQLEVPLILRGRRLAPRERRKYSAAYRPGFARSVYNKAVRMNATENKSTRQQALVLSKRKAIVAAFGPGRTVPGPTLEDLNGHDGFFDGLEDGQNARLRLEVESHPLGRLECQKT